MSSVTDNDDLVPLSGIGTIAIPSLSLSAIYYIPDLPTNLASVGKIYDSGYNVYFSTYECFIHDRTSQKVIKIGRRQGILYVL